MKQKLTWLVCIAASTFSISCNKEVATSKTAVPTSITDPSDEISALKSTDELVASVDSAGYSKLILRPGLQKGQDTWNNYLEDGNPAYLYGNAGGADQVKVQAWTIGGTPVYCRFLIRFDDLSKIAAGKTVASAKLYLSGIRTSPDILPSGNSSYPGSPYGTGDNQMLVRRVTSPWLENEVSWATQPTVTDDNEVVTKPSTKQWNNDLVIDVTSLVNDMVNNPSDSYGFSFVLQSEQIYNAFGFYSSEAAEPRDRPTLYVKYQ